MFTVLRRKCVYGIVYITHELSYTIVAMEREHIACSSLLRLAGAVLADPDPMPGRLVRGYIALAFTCLRTGTQPYHSLADF